MPIVRPFQGAWQTVADDRPHVHVAGSVQELTHVTCAESSAAHVPTCIAIAHPNVEFVGGFNGVWLCRDCGFVFTVNGPIEA